MRCSSLFALSFGSALLVGCNGGEDTDAGGSGDETTSGGVSGSGVTAATNGQSGTTDADSSSTSDASSTTGDAASSGSDTAGSTTAATDGGTATEATDGSGTTGDAGSTGEQTPELCEAPGEIMPCDAATTDPFQAMGLNCPGNPNQMIPITGESFTAPDATTWQVARQFGTATDDAGAPIWGPREGEQFLIVSSGHISPPDAAGIITHTPTATQPPGAADNPDNAELPAPMSPAHGSNNGAGGTPFVNCDGVNDCSDSLLEQYQAGNNINDLLWFQFSTVVPNGTHGFSFDFAYFSTEFPEFVDSSFNDIFVVWSNSESYTGNLCFVNDQPCTVTALWPVAHTELDPALAGTGFEQVGGGTGWYQAKGTAVPGELLQLTWAVFDMSDQIYDTTVIIDNFKWDCEGCTPSEVDPCIGIDPV